jgi:DNA-binding response OmpR family regulator
MPWNTASRDWTPARTIRLDAGADDYLTKPFALGELLARVRALLRRGMQPAAPVLEIGDLTLDPASRRVRRADREIDLSAREYSLLDHLMRNAGRTLTRSMIAERVWGYDFDSGTNVVDVYINYLRNKIDRGHSRKLIHTIRGVGYRMSASDE